MRQNTWIPNNTIAAIRAVELTDRRWLSEFITEMLERHADKWINKKIAALNKRQ